jgi:L-seryl-tRNA(Ser) seleniumtransferase
VGLGAEVIEGASEVGGGSFPGVALKTWLVRVSSRQLTPDTLAARLRQHDPPIIARIAAERVLLDPRTMSPDDLPTVAAAVRAALDG